MKKFDKELNNFVELAQKMIDAHFKLNYKNLEPNVLTVKTGRRYVKIISEARSVVEEVYGPLWKKKQVIF